eukprot:SAG22_NODE_11115_length_500_cov_1.044888_1_plen_22_part_10
MLARMAGLPLPPLLAALIWMAL